jgi:hypothetical protein
MRQLYRQIKVAEIIGVGEVRAKYANLSNPIKEGFVRVDGPGAKTVAVSKIAEYFPHDLQLLPGKEIAPVDFH